MWEPNRSYFLYSDGGEFCCACRLRCESAGFHEVGAVCDANFAIAPRLRERLSPASLAAPKLGTLVFHPSILPYRRGPDAIRRAVAAKERISGVTWFWANERLDAGDICSQFPVILHPDESAGRAYHTRFIPAGLAALDMALISILIGRPTRQKQDEALATYEGFLK